MTSDLKSFINGVRSADANIKRVHHNKKEIYKLSRLLPEEEGHKLVVLADSLVTNVCDGIKAFNDRERKSDTSHKS